MTRPRDNAQPFSSYLYTVNYGRARRRRSPAPSAPPEFSSRGPFSDTLVPQSLFLLHELADADRNAAEHILVQKPLRRPRLPPCRALLRAGRLAALPAQVGLGQPPRGGPLLHLVAVVVPDAVGAAAHAAVVGLGRLRRDAHAGNQDAAVRSCGRPLGRPGHARAEHDAGPRRRRFFPVGGWPRPRGRRAGPQRVGQERFVVAAERARLARRLGGGVSRRGRRAKPGSGLVQAARRARGQRGAADDAGFHPHSQSCPGRRRAIVGS